MATKADFTEAEWETLHRGATGAGMLVSLSDRAFFDTFKESTALAKHLAAARSNSTSLLVRDLAAVHGTGFGVTSKPDEVEAGTIGALTDSVATLTAKAPDELDAYRAFVLDLAEAVAAAAKGGGDAEAVAIAKIRAALGVTA